MRDRAVWRSVYEKIESHQMPPPKEDEQPTDAEREALLSWIMEIASRPDPELGTADPGKPPLRRLTRLEYNNAVRDLFGLEVDVFMFTERLPLGDKSYFQPAGGTMPDTIKVPLREYGQKYPVLCRNLGLPGDNRAEHGYRNRGDAMDFSPLLLEKYLAAAVEIVNATELPKRSRVFAELLGEEFNPTPADGGPGLKPKLLSSFAPDLDAIPEAAGNAMPLAEFRRRVAEAHAQGRGGVFDVPKAVANETIAGKGGVIKASCGHRLLTINPNTDLWLASFATARAASAPAILTNKQKGAKTYELTFGIEGNEGDEVIEDFGCCVTGRKGQSGTVKVTAVFTDATEHGLDLTMAEGEAGTTFVSFSATPGEGVKKLIVDGSGFSGDYVLLDDLAVIHSGLGFSPSPPQPEIGLKPKPLSLSSSPHERLATFAELACRRPLSENEHAIFRKLFDEANGTPGESGVSPLEDHELATRLALFLWASTPDAELLDLARENRLHEHAVLEAQTRRMLKDPKCRELSESFAVQWLRLDQLSTAKPDRDLYEIFYSGPQGKSTLHGAMLTEALLLFETVLVEDRSILDFIAADYTWLNGGLARLYGIPLGDAVPVVAANAGNDPTREVKTKGDGSHLAFAPGEAALGSLYVSVLNQFGLADKAFGKATGPLKRLEIG